MINDFLDLFIKETIATIEGLTGQTPTLSLKDEQDIAGGVSSIIPPTSIVDIDVSGDVNAKAAMVVPPSLATALADMMLGGEGESKEEMDDEDLDATKEIVSNIMGALSTALNSQTELPVLNLKVTNIKFLGEADEVDTSDFSKIFVYSFVIGDKDSLIMFMVDSSLLGALSDSVVEGDDDDIGAAASSGPSILNTPEEEGIDLIDKEIKNINLILDVKLPVRVRIGSKLMLLKDVLSMDIGSVVELNQHANDPLDILVDNTVIAQGEVVIVDGNFGVQITNIGSKKDRLKKLRG